MQRIPKDYDRGTRSSMDDERLPGVPYQRVAGQLRAEIESGQRRPGEQLPTAGKLAPQYGVSRNTMIKALEILKSEGLIVVELGWGTFVAGSPS